MSETVDWTNGRWLDGPKIADWLERWIHRRFNLDQDPVVREGFSTVANGDTVCRMVYRWRHDSKRASVYALDRILSQYGGHISEIPDDLWCREDSRRRRHKNYQTPERLEAVQYSIEHGIDKAAVLFKVTPRTIRNWRARYNEVM